MNGDQWSAVGLVLYVAIMAAVVLVMTVIFRTSDLRRDIAERQRDYDSAAARRRTRAAFAVGCP